MPAPQSRRFRPRIPAPLSPPPHPIQKAVRSPPLGVTAWCPPQPTSHRTHLETQKEVRSASTSSTFLAGTLRASPPLGSAPPKPGATPAAPIPVAPLAPWVFIPSSHYTSPHLRVDAIPTTELQTVSPCWPVGHLRLNPLARPEHVIQCSSRKCRGCESHPDSLLSGGPPAASQPSHT